MIVLQRTQCCYPGCSDYADHQHHVTYEPEAIKPLCRTHHEDITIINGQQSRKYRRGLSNRHRWWIWFQWLDGKLKPRRTRKALDYIEEWDRPRSSVDWRMPVSYEPPVQFAPPPPVNDPQPKAKVKRKEKPVAKRKKAAQGKRKMARKSRRKK
jgi:hypothetical protein